MSFQKNSSSVRRYGKMMKFASWMQNVPNKVTPPPFRLMQIGSQFWQSRVLYAVASFDIATVLSDKTLAYGDIAQLVSANPDALYRVLRMTSAMGIFEETAPGHYKNNKMSDCLREGNPQNVRAMVLMHNSDEMSRPWYESLIDGIKNGDTPFKLTHGDNLFEYMDTHPEFDALFSMAMDSVESLTGDSYVTDFDWGRFKRIVDVGGSRGSKSAAILKKHNNLEALVFDRPQVVEEAEAYWANHEDDSLSERIAFQAGDIFSSIPKARSNDDIYLLSAVFHGFDDDRCIQIVKNLVDATNGHNVYIAIMEIVMDESQANLPLSTFDMQMFMGTDGRERTLNEWLSILDAGGLSLKEVVNLRSFPKILVTQPVSG